MRILLVLIATTFLFGGTAVAQRTSKPKSIRVDLSKEKLQAFTHEIAHMIDALKRRRGEGEV